MIVGKDRNTRRQINSIARNAKQQQKEADSLSGEFRRTRAKRSGAYCFAPAVLGFAAAEIAVKPTLDAPSVVPSHL
eukprot:1051717-Rhodomonas_salina.3